MAKSPLIRLSPADQVAIALSPLASGTSLSPYSPATALNEIPAGHKVAIPPIAEGEEVYRLGQPIGLAARAIAAGEHVHIHNLAYPGSLADPRITITHRAKPVQKEVPSFRGFRRADGRVGTRNYIGVLTTVNCSARVAKLIAGHFQGPQAGGKVDGVVPLTHSSGCSVSDGSPSMDMLRRTIAGYARNPNFAGVLIVGLGCEDNQIDLLCAQEGLELGRRVRSLGIQDRGGTTRSVEAGVAIVEELIAEASLTRREAVPVSELVVGLQCGGSDSFSGLTAIPPWVPRSTSSSAMAEPRSFPKRRRFTAPKICCCSASPAKRSAAG